jgi:hypothetical protein
MIDRRIEQILELKLAPPAPVVQNLGEIDAPPSFDVETRYNNSTIRTAS